MSAPATRIYAFDRLELDTAEQCLLREGRRIHLTPKVYETLLALVRQHGHTVAKDELLRAVWPDVVVEENNLAQNISVLRKVLGERPGGGDYIETVPRRGYRFVADVVERSESREPSDGLLHTIGSDEGSHWTARETGGQEARAPFRRAERQLVLAVAVAVLALVILLLLLLQLAGTRQAAGRTEAPLPALPQLLPVVTQLLLRDCH